MKLKFLKEVIDEFVVEQHGHTTVGELVDKTIEDEMSRGSSVRSLTIELSDEDVIALRIVAANRDPRAKAAKPNFSDRAV